MPKIYVSSKRQHVELWRTWRRRGYNIISTWIDLDGAWDNELIGQRYWPIWLAEAADADFLIFYSAAWDGHHEGSLLEIAAALVAKKSVLCVGVSDTLKTTDGEWADFTFHPAWQRMLDLDTAFKYIANQILDAECQEFAD